MDCQSYHLPNGRGRNLTQARLIGVFPCVSSDRNYLSGGKAINKSLRAVGGLSGGVGGQPVGGKEVTQRQGKICRERIPVAFETCFWASQRLTHFLEFFTV